MIELVLISLAVYLIIGVVSLALEIAIQVFENGISDDYTVEKMDAVMLSIIPFWPYWLFCLVLDLVSPLKNNAA